MDFDEDEFLAGLAPPAVAQAAGRLEGTALMHSRALYQYLLSDCTAPLSAQRCLQPVPIGQGFCSKSPMPLLRACRVRQQDSHPSKKQQPQARRRQHPHELLKAGRRCSHIICQERQPSSGCSGSSRSSSGSSWHVSKQAAKQPSLQHIPSRACKALACTWQPADAPFAHTLSHSTAGKLALQLRSLIRTRD